MKNKRWWVFCWVCIWSRLAVAEDVAQTTDNNGTQTNDNSKDLRTIFSPRMDYDQWKPLGRGDPLKNDPTYDYVPPVLDRVHYWMDPALRKPDPPAPGESQKTEILLLGVSSKKPSTGTSVADSRKDTYDSFLKFVDGPKFNNHQRIARPHYPMASSSYYPPPFYAKNKSSYSKGNEQRMPYTMLMPPPMITRNPPSPVPSPQPMTLQQMSTKTTPPSTTMPSVTPSEVTVQAANLVYHSSSLGDFNDWKSTEASTNLTPNPYPASTKNITPQKHLQPPESYIQIQFAPARNNFTNKPLIASSSDHNINFVTPPPLTNQEVMHKGHVSDDNLDISNTYVKIGKTEAQVHPTGIDNLPPQNMMIFSHVKHPMMVSEMTPQTPLTMQTLQHMLTMQPPPVTMTPIYRKKTTNPILQALERERTETEPTVTTTTEKEDVTVMTTTPTTTTTSLTTDPLFKHYKQPAEPLRGPLYLIIQGHSKVKTYGPSKRYHGIQVQETNEITDDKDEEVQHLHGQRKNEERSREGRSGNLQTLKHVIQTGLGAIDFAETAQRRQDVKEAELQFGYKVGDDVTSEKYHKGFVEEARKLKQR